MMMMMMMMMMRERERERRALYIEKAVCDELWLSEEKCSDQVREHKK
jgi:hypothetical protein